MDADVRIRGALELTRQVKIVLTQRDVQLLPRGSAAARSLSFADLLTLELLATTPGAAGDEVAGIVEGRLGSPTSVTGQFIDELQDLGLFRESLSDSVVVDQRPDHDGPSADGFTSVEGQQFLVPIPRVLDLGTSGFGWLDHDGSRQLHLCTSELDVLRQFCRPTSVDDAWAAHRESAGSLALSRQDFGVVLRRFLNVGLARDFEADDPVNGRYTLVTLREAVARRHHVGGALEAAKDRFEEEQRQHREKAEVNRVRVLAVYDNPILAPPLAPGMCVAYAKVFDDGRLNRHYGFDPRFVIQSEALEAVAVEPTVFLFSNYLWDSAVHLEQSAKLKRANPASLTIHGGPDTPKYPGDVERFFRDHPHVDVAVHGEGEITFAELLAALEGQIGEGPPDLSALAEVPGLSFRDGDRVVRTADRDRVADLDQLPSPYLTGLFDPFGACEGAAIILETNRGCPYGCTFCDWGSATLSRIRKFDLDRVFAELEWCAHNEIRNLALADANFGIFERDIAIAEKVRDLKAEFGFPVTLGTNYAKNTVKHLRKIIEVFAEAEILTEGVVSLQSMDPPTLETIKRSNIKVEKYNDLSVEFRKAGLPLAVDLMMGLPGSTPASFRADLQHCADRDIRTRIHLTALLTNSPMNAPDYRREHGIVALPGQHVEQTATFTQSEWNQMARLRDAFLLFDAFGALRHVAMYVRAESGIHEVDFYERLLLDTDNQPDRWPTVGFTVQVVPSIMAPPGSWRSFLDEIGGYIVTELGVADDPPLRTALDVQHSLLPAYERSFPTRIDLPHDFAAWHSHVLETRDQGHRHDWETIATPLRDFGPAEFLVHDPDQVCSTNIGGSPDSLLLRMVAWEMDSPVSRPQTGPKARQAVAGLVLNQA